MSKASQRGSGLGSGTARCTPRGPDPATVALNGGWVAAPPGEGVALGLALTLDVTLPLGEALRLGEALLVAPALGVGEADQVQVGVPA